MYNPKQLKYVEDKAFENYMYNNHFYNQVNNAVTPPIYDVTPVIVYDQKVARRNIIESFLWNPIQTMRSARTGASPYNQRGGQYPQHGGQYPQHGGQYREQYGSRSNFSMGRESRVSHLAAEKPAASTKQCCDLLSGLSTEYPAEFPCAGRTPTDWATKRAGKAIDIETRNKIVNALGNINTYYDYVDKIKETEAALANSSNSPSAEMVLNINLSTYRTIKTKLESMFLESLGFVPSINERDNCVFDTNTFSYTNLINDGADSEDILTSRPGLKKLSGGIKYIREKVPKFSNNDDTQKILSIVMLTLLIIAIVVLAIVIYINRRRIGRGLRRIADWMSHGAS